MYQFDLVPKVPGKDKGTSPRGEAGVPTRVRGNTDHVGLVETDTEGNRGHKTQNGLHTSFLTKLRSDVLQAKRPFAQGSG